MSRSIVAARASEARAGRPVTPATFRVRRGRQTWSQRFMVSMVTASGPEYVGGAENIRDAITLALEYLTPNDRLDVQATI